MRICIQMANTVTVYYTVWHLGRTKTQILTTYKTNVCINVNCEKNEIYCESLKMQ